MDSSSRFFPARFARCLHSALLSLRALALGLTLSGVVGCGGGSKAISAVSTTNKLSSAATTITQGSSAAVPTATAATTTTTSNSGDLATGTLPTSGIGSRYFVGVALPWYNIGTDFGTGGWNKYTDWQAIDRAFAAMEASGARVVGWWLFADGRYSPDFNADGTVSGLDSNVLTDMDHALLLAANHHLYLFFSLTTAGLFNPGSNVNGVQMGGHPQIVTDAGTQQTYLDNALKPLLQHIAASPYRSSVLAYDVCCEPEGAMAGYWGNANLDTVSMQQFVQQSVRYVHLYGGGTPATVGSAKPSWVSLWKNLGLDFYTIHYYPGMDTNGPGSGLPSVASLGLDKPCMVGEFATNAISYGLNDTAPLSARWYLETIPKLGYAGAVAWSYTLNDSASNWKAFQPVFANWTQAHKNELGP